MPAKATIIYIREKYVHETRFENYLMDMLWAPANGMQFKNSKRYGEFSKQEQHYDNKSGDEIVDGIIANLLK